MEETRIGAETAQTNPCHCGSPKRPGGHSIIACTGLKSLFDDIPVGRGVVAIGASGACLAEGALIAVTNGIAVMRSEWGSEHRVQIGHVVSVRFDAEGKS